jgi:two-component system, cell cycle sensor histidine kinase and response regulator CckA
MTDYGDFALVSGALQLTIPSYSLRLVRRFGTPRVGWFVVTAFASLALLNLLPPLRSVQTWPGNAITLDLVVAIAVTLLVIGMCHLETLLSVRQESEHEERRIQSEWQARMQGKTADLVQANQQLLRQIARLKQAEGELRQSQAEYCLLFEAHPQAMWIFDLRSLRILAGNRAALSQYGFSDNDLTALTARDLLPPSAAARLLGETVKPCLGVQSRGLGQRRRKDGTLMDVEIAALDLSFGGSPARLVIATELSPHRKHEKETCDAQKHELACRFAAGVAHHFNNTLSIISGYASLLQHHTHDQQTVEHLRQISSAVTCAAGLSRQLLITSGQFALRREPLDLNGLIKNLDPIVQRLVGKEVVLRQSCASSLPQIHADAYLVEHILINLVLNARDAMRGGGALTISSELISAGTRPHVQNCPAQTGDFVCLAVRDTGCGLTPEVEAHLFEPFFTTRGVGNGRGLGLASVQGAVRQHQGWIEYTTAPGMGTEFRVFFPVALPSTAFAESGFGRWIRL